MLFYLNTRGDSERITFCMFYTVLFAIWDSADHWLYTSRAITLINDRLIVWKICAISLYYIIQYANFWMVCWCFDLFQPRKVTFTQWHGVQVAKNSLQFMGQCPPKPPYSITSVRQWQSLGQGPEIQSLSTLLEILFLWVALATSLQDMRYDLNSISAWVDAGLHNVLSNYHYHFLYIGKAQHRFTWSVDSEYFLNWARDTRH